MGAGHASRTFAHLRQWEKAPISLFPGRVKILQALFFSVPYVRWLQDAETRLSNEPVSLHHSIEYHCWFIKQCGCCLFFPFLSVSEFPCYRKRHRCKAKQKNADVINFARGWRHAPRGNSKNNFIQVSNHGQFCILMKSLCMSECEIQV